MAAINFPDSPSSGDTYLGYTFDGTKWVITPSPVVSSVNGKVVTANVNDSVVRNITVSTLDPSGGNDGDIWIKYV